MMVFLPGLAQIFQFCEILQRALDLGWTEMLIPLPFHGQRSHEDIEAVLSDPTVLASTGRYPLGQNKSLFAPESFEAFSAPTAFQELWAAHREPRFARSCIVCANVAESGITIPNVGLVISSGVQRRVSTDVRTGATVNALQTLSKAQLLQQLLETHLASRWEGVRLPRASGTSPDFPGSSPNFPGSFSATSPEVLSLWNLAAIQGFPGSFPDFPGSSPDFPGSSPDFPGGQPLSLGSLTPSPDSQKLSLKLGRSGRTDCGTHITMMSHDQYLSQVRSADLAQLEESDVSPYDLTFPRGRKIFCEASILVPSSSIGSDTCKGTHVPTWNPGHEGSNQDGTCHSMHGSAV